MFERIVSFDNLILAAEEAAKGKRYKSPVMNYMANVEEHVINTQNHLIWGSYRPSSHRQFYVYEPKKRLISAPPFKDRVVHHAIHQIIEPEIDKRFIFDSYACRAGKGTHQGADRAQKFLRIVHRNHGRVYALKADISKYFNSINHDTLKHILKKQIRCQRTYLLLCRIIDGPDCESGGVGIPIGNLTSQLFANVYLNELDQYVKHALREKYYIRYMDDFVIIHHDKAHLQRLRVDIENWLLINLQLTTNHKTQVFPVSATRGRSLDFLGFRIYITHRLMRKCTEKRMRYKVRKLRTQYASGEASLQKVRSVISSYAGHAKHANAHNLISNILSQPFIKGELHESV